MSRRLEVLDRAVALSVSVKRKSGMYWSTLFLTGI